MLMQDKRCVIPIIGFYAVRYITPNLTLSSDVDQDT